MIHVMCCLHMFQGELSFYAVYDGHGGVEAAKYAAVQLHSVLGHKLQSQSPKEALFAAFQETDRMFVDRAKREVRGQKTEHQLNFCAISTFALSIFFLPFSISFKIKWN